MNFLCEIQFQIFCHSPALECRSLYWLQFELSDAAQSDAQMQARLLAIDDAHSTAQFYADVTSGST